MRTGLRKDPAQFVGEPLGIASTTCDIDAIEANRWQPRSVFDDEALRELAASIREVGVLQPLVVRPLPGGRYELIAGERRLRASRLAGLRRVPIVVRSATNQAALELALIENLQRADIGAMECARAYRRLLTEFGLTQQRVADKVGKARASVANTLRLLTLPPKIQDGLETGLITEGHARALLAFDDQPAQLSVYQQILAKGLSVREIERLASQRRAARRKAPVSGYADLEERLSMRLGSPVKIQPQGPGGRVVIEFFSEDELAEIVDRLGADA